ncbi:MAG: hypothetical protein NWF13_05185 [Candidatus Bathyarchaeota archaeon]|nr:hypothetical protein [Candidatus Bathyarchaeota archaeon]
MTYRYVPSGFEIVINKKEICPGSSGGIWNLWWNVKLTDDPEAWGKEIQSINKLQDQLVDLSLGRRLIRAQMAEFCRLSPYFPQSIDLLCKAIGDRCFSKPVRMGCEGRRLLNALGHNDPQSLTDQLKEILTEYRGSLEKWLIHSQPETPTASKISGFLGQPTEAKEVFVKNLMSVIDLEEPSIDSLKKLVENRCIGAQRNLEALRFRPFNCINCEGSAPPTPKCQCCYSMLIDAGLLCAGTFNEKRSMRIEFQRFIEEHVLAYVLAINSWLKDERTTHVTSLITPRYITRDNVVVIAEGVPSLLGERDEAKVWLTACLLKTIKDNQRWHKRAELLDGFPEAVSWLTEIQQ